MLSGYKFPRSIGSDFVDTYMKYMCYLFQERISKFQSNVLTQAKKGGVLVMKNKIDIKDTKTLMHSSAK